MVIHRILIVSKGSPVHDTLADVGEQKVIAEIISHAPSALNGDDAAVLRAPAPNTRVVAATDMMVQDNHFRLDWSSGKEVGYKCVFRNFADIESMGARPVSALLALAAPPETPLETVSEIARGVSECLKRYNAELIGGDVTHAQQLLITVTALGTLGGNMPPLKLNAARPGHKVVAHGKIGWAAAGLALLQRFGRELPAKLTHLQPLILAQCAPQLDPGRGVVARATGAAAMTDNSDGLIPDLTTMATKSQVTIDLDPLALAPHPLLEEAGQILSTDPWQWVLSGGEDHTLVGTTAYDAPSGFHVIGEVTSPKNHPVTVAGRPSVYSTGWKAY